MKYEPTNEELEAALTAFFVHDAPGFSWRDVTGDPEGAKQSMRLALIAAKREKMKEFLP